MKVTQLGENLFEIRLPLLYWSAKKHLIAGLLEIQDNYSREIICIQKIGLSDSYLVVTKGGKGE